MKQPMPCPCGKQPRIIDNPTVHYYNRFKIVCQDYQTRGRPSEVSCKKSYPVRAGSSEQAIALWNRARMRTKTIDDSSEERCQICHMLEPHLCLSASELASGERRIER